MYQYNLKSQIKRIFCLFVAVVLLNILPGCSAFAGLGVEPVTLRFLYVENAVDYEPIAQAFHEKYPNITIELDPVPVDAGGRNPLDIMRGKVEGADIIRVPAMVSDDELLQAALPLDTYITTDKDFPQDDYFSGSLEGLKVNGKQIGIPAGLNPYVVYYDPTKFQIKGVTPPNASWTLEDFMTSVMAVHSADESLIGTPEYTYGFCSSPEFSDPVILSYVFGGGVFDNIYAPTNPTLNTQANVESLTWYASLRNEFGLMPASNEPRDVGMLIVRSNCGFWMDWLDRSGFGSFLQDRDLAALPLPIYNTSISISTLEYYSIFSTSLHPDEAWKWLRFLIDQPTASGWLIPPRQSHISSIEYSTHAANDVLGIANSMPSQGVVLGLETIRDSRLGNVLSLYVEATIKVMGGDVTAQTALDEAQQKAVQSFGQ